MKKRNNGLYFEVSKRDFDALKKKGSISAFEFRELMVKGGKTSNKQIFSFVVSFAAGDNGCIVTMTGKHLSKNRYNAMGRRDQMRYKGAIKKALSQAALVYREEIKKHFFEKVKIEYVVYNPRSRDDDANYETLKPLRDGVVSFFKIFPDDKRSVVLKSKEREVISRKYKVEMKIQNAEE